ncbi:MAG: T9SS type A sorting domain-containing protein [Fibrobacteres bacterium]|nr:T9SS type A sorting domain-containing protein [Fibrobacterota bacterium]
MTKSTITAILLTAVFTFSAFNEWQNFTCTKRVQAITFDGLTSWYGTEGGLFEATSSTVKKYDKLNSKLPSNDITCILNAAGGIKWIGTNGGGLVRWRSASDIDLFNTKNGSLLNDAVHGLAISSTGSVYVVTDKGLSVYNGTGWQHYNNSNTSLPEDVLNCIAIKKNGDIFVGSNGMGLLKFAGGDFEDVGITAQYINALAVDSNGNLWAAAYSRGVTRISSTGTATEFRRPTHALPSNNVWSVAAASNGDIWAATDNGCARYKGTSWSTQTTAVPNVNVIAVSPAGEPLCGTTDGLYKFDGTNFIAGTALPTELPSSFVNTTLWDGTNLWVATIDGGLAKNANSSWTYYNNKNSILPTNRVNALAKSGTCVYVGTGIYPDTGNIIKICGAADFTSLKERLFVSNLYPDKSGNLWINTEGKGLHRYNGTTLDSFTMSNSSIPSNNSLAITEDSDGALWIALAERYNNTSTGLCKFTRNGGNTFTMFTSANSSIPENFINSISTDASGKLWMGTNASGLVSFDRSSAWATFSTGNSAIPAKMIHSVARDSTGNIWLATSEGLVRYNGSSQWMVYTVLNSNLPSSKIRDIRVDSENRKWISTEKGITVCTTCDTGLEIAAEKVSSSFAETEEISVYPQPANPTLTIKIRNITAGPCEVSLLNAAGKSIRKLYRSSRTEGSLNLIWDGKDDKGTQTASGIYVMRLTTTNSVILRKVTMMR